MHRVGALPASAVRHPPLRLPRTRPSAHALLQRDVRVLAQPLPLRSSALTVRPHFLPLRGAGLACLA
jgi:hypothetical protein